MDENKIHQNDFIHISSLCSFYDSKLVSNNHHRAVVNILILVHQAMALNKLSPSLVIPKSSVKSNMMTSEKIIKDDRFLLILEPINQ